jgi:hypothetical protein
MFVRSFDVLAYAYNFRLIHQSLKTKIDPPVRFYLL